jgi:hypothetical protein
MFCRFARQTHCMTLGLLVLQEGCHFEPLIEVSVDSGPLVFLYNFAEVIECLFKERDVNSLHTSYYEPRDGLKFFFSAWTLLWLASSPLSFSTMASASCRS